MTNRKLQEAIDELERLRDTVAGFSERNATPPNPDSDAGRALSELEDFSDKLSELRLGRFVNHGKTKPPFLSFRHWWRQFSSAR